MGDLCCKALWEVEKTRKVLNKYSPFTTEVLLVAHRCLSVNNWRPVMRAGYDIENKNMKQPAAAWSGASWDIFLSVGICWDMTW